MSKEKSIQKAEQSNFVIFMAIPLIIIAISLVSINHFWGTRAYNKRVIGVRTDARDLAVKNVDSLDKLSQSLSDLEKQKYDSGWVLDALPSRYDFPALATSIEKLIQQNGLELESFIGQDDAVNAVNEQSSPEPVDIPLTVSVTGSYIEIQDFIQQLEASIRPIQVQEITFSGNDGTMSSTIKMLTFYQPSESLDFTTVEVK